MHSPMPLKTPAASPLEPLLGWWQGLRRSRDDLLLNKALAQAEEPGLVMDLCGDGADLALLARKRNRILIAADESRAMLEHLRARQPESVLERLHLLPTDLDRLDLVDNAVDCVLCLGLLHHLSALRRYALLHELQRVARQSLIVSMLFDELGPTPEVFEWQAAQMGFDVRQIGAFTSLRRGAALYLLRKGF